MPREYDTYHTHHRSRRLAGWDYTGAAAYFVTICTQDRVCLFGGIERGRMYLSEKGRIVVEEWRRSEALRDEVHLDAFVVMPNHVHGIIVIAPPEANAPTDPRGYDLTTAQTEKGDVASHGGATQGATQGLASLRRNPQSLGSMVAGFKAVATKRINRRRGTPGAAVWQRGYHDRILRNEREWRAARRYIRQNPARWHKDTHYSTKR